MSLQEGPKKGTEDISTQAEGQNEASTAPLKGSNVRCASECSGCGPACASASLPSSPPQADSLLSPLPPSRPLTAAEGRRLQRCRGCCWDQHGAECASPSRERVKQKPLPRGARAAPKGESPSRSSCAAVSRRYAKIERARAGQAIKGSNTIGQPRTRRKPPPRLSYQLRKSEEREAIEEPERCCWPGQENVRANAPLGACLGPLGVPTGPRAHLALTPGLTSRPLVPSPGTSLLFAVLQPRQISSAVLFHHD
jgi:hypothetical protein